LSQREAQDSQTSPERLAVLASKFPLEVSQNPTTRPEVLRRLIELNDPMILCGIAKNPNISPDLASLLLQKFPFELVENPAWKMLLLESPGFLEKNISQFVISKMLDEQILPAVLVSHFAAHKSSYIRKRVARYLDKINRASLGDR
jgi:hypothetical protein